MVGRNTCTIGKAAISVVKMVVQVYPPRNSLAPVTVSGLIVCVSAFGKWLNTGEHPHAASKDHHKQGQPRINE